MRQLNSLRNIFFSLLILIAATNNAAALNIEDYGLLPDIRSVSISPDGKHYALIKRGNSGDAFYIVNIAKNEVVAGVDASAVKARSVYFATNEHVILLSSKTRRSFRIRGKWEQDTAISFNLKTKKMKVLPTSYKDLYEAQSGLGRIVGINEQKKEVYMPAYVGASEPRNDLLRVNIDNGRALLHARGNHYVIDWFVGDQGKVLAREEYREREQEHRVLSKVSGKWKTIYTKKTDVPDISILAINHSEDALIYSESYQDADAIYSMSLSDGSITGPMFEEEKTDIQSILTTSLNRKFDGILYSGLLPSYQFLDENHQANMAAIQDLYPGSEIHPISNTADKSRSVILVSGNEGADNYLIFDSIERRVSLLGTGYPEVSKDKIAPVKAIRYKARDGLSISAIITKPLNSENAKKLPMIVMPHGGPESYDSIRFDWWAQFLARKGYLVLQPNFRGSSGFGNDFRIAGRGKWGKEMQDDVSDGVLAMIKTGAADPDRVCIVGASYGGYAAMAGGAFSPDLYRCVVAVAGVSDIPKMLRDQAYTSGKRHWVVSYWNSVIGNSKSEKEKLNKISPVNAAANFKAPLLMLHGKDDTVVPIVQSKRMLKAMRKAGKQAELITLKGEDHWLSSSETRLELLKSVSDFLDQYNPTDNLIPMESLNHSSAVQ